jgi:hypothetical protein
MWEEKTIGKALRFKDLSADLELSNFTFWTRMV